MRYATFNARMIAVSIDLALIMLVAEPLIDFITNGFFPDIETGSFMALLSHPEAPASTDRLLAGLWKLIREQHLLERLVLENLLDLVFIAAYTIPFWLRFSTTPGKWLLKLQICDAQTGLRMTPKQCLDRFAGYILSALPFTLGFIYALFNKKKQGFHDLLAHTVVVVAVSRKEMLKRESQV